MSTAINDFVMRKTALAWVALLTCVALLVPLVAMQFTTEVRWDGMDFAVMGVLLFVTGSVFVLAARKLPRKYWLAAGAFIGAAFLYVWAELAVGIFTHLGS